MASQWINACQVCADRPGQGRVEEPPQGAVRECSRMGCDAYDGRWRVPAPGSECDQNVSHRRAAVCSETISTRSDQDSVELVSYIQFGISNTRDTR